jgi:hypothetical protein
MRGDFAGEVADRRPLPFIIWGERNSFYCDSVVLLPLFKSVAVGSGHHDQLHNRGNAGSVY